MSAVLSATGLTKRYGGVTALAGAGIALLPGEVHSLVGENGAGKSTLVKMLSGVVRPDQGTLELDGRTVEFRSARDAGADVLAFQTTDSIVEYQDRVRGEVDRLIQHKIEVEYAEALRLEHKLASPNITLGAFN